MKNRIRIILIAVAAMISFGAMAQVTGTVVDVNGEPVIGASILEVGTTNGTITDFDGNFTITTQPNAVLQISYIGYKAQEVSVAGQNVFKITLHEDNELLEEVVVVGYGTVKKNDATGSVTAIKPDEMNKGIQTTATDMLQGKIAGVNIVTSGGTPGGGASIRIRGGSSLNASNDPLIVIDGLAMDNQGIPGAASGLSMVNPNDIETFTVLKDASATAIYGSRASNGVILITTKKGASGSKLKVSYDGQVSVGSPINQYDVLTGDQLRAYTTVAGLSQSERQNLMAGNTDWQKEIYRTSVSTDHNISLMGGVKNKVVDMPYRASVGYTLNNGIVKESQMQRVTASLNLSPSFLDNHLKFNLNAKGMYIYNKYEQGQVGSAIYMDPTAPIYGGATSIWGDQIVSDELINAEFGGFYQPTSQSTSATGAYNDPNWTLVPADKTKNPIAGYKQNSSIANSGVFVGNLDADYAIHGLEDLHLHANFGADYTYGKQDTKQSPYGTFAHYYGSNGTWNKSIYNLQFNCYAQYGHDWEEAQQHFDVMAGYEWQHFYHEDHSEGTGYYQSTNLDPKVAGQPYGYYKSESKSESYLVSFFGRINYVGWNQLLITATVRGDGSSRFSKENRWGVFPSVALGWKIKESFMKDINEVNDLKLRLGYGITGQQEGIGDYSYMPTYTQAKPYEVYYPVGYNNPAVEDKEGYTVQQVYDAAGNPLYLSSRPNAFNPNLTWEKTTTYNAGLDYGFLNNRINGSIDYYYRITTDLLNVVDVAAGTNFRNRVMSNIGSLYNQGVEFAINAVIIDRKNFKWDFGYNFAWNENKITKLNGGETQKDVDGSGYTGVGMGGAVTKYAVGYATNTFHLYETVQREDENGNKAWYAVDRNRDGQLSTSDKYYGKNPIAPYQMGFQTKFQFYGFDLGMCFRANIGNYVYNRVLADHIQSADAGSIMKSSYADNTLTCVVNSYLNDKFTSSVGMLTYDENGNEVLNPNVRVDNYGMCDYFLEDASFLRCDNITLGYSFKTKNMKLSGRAYCTVSNPFVITKYSGLDPEVGSSGVDNTIYPRSLSTVLGINLQF